PGRRRNPTLGAPPYATPAPWSGSCRPPVRVRKLSRRHARRTLQSLGPAAFHVMMRSTVTRWIRPAAAHLNGRGFDAEPSPHSPEGVAVIAQRGVATTAQIPRQWSALPDLRTMAIHCHESTYQPSTRRAPSCFRLPVSARRLSRDPNQSTPCLATR